MNRRGKREESRLVGALCRDRAALLLTTALSATVIAVVALPAHAQLASTTEPQGGVVVAGAARISATPSATVITQSSARAAVNWQSFNVGAAATVDFVQPSARAVTLNRVLAPDPSVIAGQIHANGGIVITNRSGVVFTQGSEVDAASVLVSAAGISNRNFMAGRMQFDIRAKPGARIVNAGRITVRETGLAALVAPEVANSGVITAKLGHVILAGGAAAATLDLYGDGLVSLDVTREARVIPGTTSGRRTALVTNTGTIIAQGGTVQLSARQADGLVQDLVDAGGTIAANSLGTHTGVIAIAGIGGSVTVPGTLLAEGTVPGTKGGAIALDATATVAVAKGAEINASGAAGGGTIAVGTTLRRAAGGAGVTARLTARRTVIAEGASISADATVNGDGGRVTVLSTASTADHGAISAEGGATGGNGGHVEVSGHDLTLDGSVNTSAPLGLTGSILLDPYNLDIVASGADDGDITSAPTNGVAAGSGNITPGTTDTVSAGAIEGLTGDVTVQAINNLEVSVNLELTKADQSLTLEAGNNLTVDSGVTVAATGNVELAASSTAITGATTVGALVLDGVVNAGTNVSLSAGTGGIMIDGAVNAASVVLTSTGGGAVFEATGSIAATTLSGSSTGASLTGVNTLGTLAGFDTSSGGTFNLKDESPLTITGNVVVAAGSFLAIEADTLSILNDRAANLGSLIAPGGGVELAPLSAGHPVALIQNGATASPGTLSIDNTELALIDASLLQIGASTAGPISIGNSGDAITVPVAQLALDSGSSITESGALSVGSLFAAAASATLDSPANAITNLGNVTTTAGGFSLTEAAGQGLLIAGTISVPAGQALAITADGIAFASTGSLSAAGGPVTLVRASPGLPIDLTTGLATASIGTLSLGPVPGSAAIGAATLAIGRPGDGAITVTGPISLPGVGLLDLSSVGNLGETTADSLSVGTLEAHVGSAALIGPNAIGTLGNVTALGGFSFNDTQNLTVSGLLDAGTATVQLTDPGSTITEPGGTITAGTLTGSAAAATLDGPNSIANLAAFSAIAGGFSLTEVANQPLIVSGSVSVAGGQTLALTADGLAFGAAGSLVAAGSGGMVSLATATETLPIDLTTGRPAASVGTLSLGGSLGAGAIAAGTLAIGTAAGGAITITGPLAFSGVGLLALSSGGTLGETTADSLSVGTLEANVASAGLIGPNAVGTLGNVTALAGLSFDDTQNLTLSGRLGAGTATVQLTAPGSAITETGGAIDAGTLTGSATAATLGDANSITTLAGFAATVGGFSLADAVPLTITGAVNADAAGLTFTINGGLRETALGALTAATLTGSAASASLGGPNSIGALVGFTANSGNFSLAEAAGQTLTVTGNVSVPTGQTLTLDADALAIENDNLLTFGSLIAPAGTVALIPASSFLPIAFIANGASARPGTLSLSDADLALINATLLQVGNGSAGPILIGNPGDAIVVPSRIATLVLESAGAITENGSLSTAELTGFAASASLPAAGNAIGLLGSFTALAGFSLTNAGNLSLVGPLDAGGATADLASATGGIAEQGGLPGGTITAGTLAASATGNVVLDDANSIATLGNITAPRGFTLDNPAGFFIVGNLDAGAGTVLFTSAGSAIENGGRIAAGTLTGTLAAASLGGPNTIGALAALTVPGGLSLTDQQALTITGLLDAGTGSIAFTINGGGLGETGLGQITAGQLSGSAATASLPNAANVLPALGAFTTPSGFTLATDSSLTLTGVVNAGAAPIALTSSGSIAEASGGSLIAGVLEGFAGSGTLATTAGIASFANLNSVAQLGSFAALGGFTLADSGSLQLIGALDAGGAVANLTGGAAVSEPTGSIHAGALTGTLASASLGGANVIAELGSFTALGGFTLADAGDLLLTGPVSAGSAGALFSVTGNLVETAAGLLAAGTLAGNAAVFNLPNTGNLVAALGNLTAPGGLTLATASGLTITGVVDIAGPASLISGGSIAEVSEGRSVGTVIAGVLEGAAGSGTLTGSAGNASFGNVNTIAELGNFTALGGFTLDNAGDLPLAAPVEAGGATADLIAGGSLFETTGLISAGRLSGSAATVYLNAANRIATLGPFSAGPFSLTDAESLTVLGTLAANPIVLSVTGDLALGSGAGPALLASPGAVALTATGAITEPNGAIAAASLTGSAASASLGGANLLASLAAFTTSGSFLLDAAGPALVVTGPVTAVAATLAAAGSLLLAGRIDASSVTLTAADTITQSGGAIAAGGLSGTAAAATFSQPNAIGTLAAFATPGTLSLTDSTPLVVAGPVSASALAITDAAGVSFTGSTTVGTLDINARGPITEPSGSLAAGLLLGSAAGLAQFGPDAPAGTAVIATLGSFTVATGTFTLTDQQALTIDGPLAANDFAITAPGSIVLNGATIRTIGLPPAQQSGVNAMRPGSYFSVTTAGGLFAALGTTRVNPDGGASTIRIQLPAAGGAVTFMNFVAPTTTLILDLGQGTASGQINLAGLIALGNNGSAALTGTIDNIPGVVASSKAVISPFQSAKYRLNSCPLMSINCIVIAPEQVPQGNPLSGLSVIGLPPDRRDIDLLLPNIAAQDY